MQWGADAAHDTVYHKWSGIRKRPPAGRAGRTSGITATRNRRVPRTRRGHPTYQLRAVATGKHTPHTPGAPAEIAALLSSTRYPSVTRTSPSPSPCSGLRWTNLTVPSFPASKWSG